MSNIVKTEESTTTKQLLNKYFPELPLFIISSLIFLDIGILFGAANSFRFGQVSNATPSASLNEFITKYQIHQTHWTSTILGGITLLMLGQIYFFHSRLNEGKNRFHLATVVVLITWLLGILSSYLSVWVDYDKYIPYTRLLIKFSATVYLLLILSFLMNTTFRENAKNHFAIYHLITASFWLWLSVILWFDITSGALDRMFLFTYIYGFFSLTLFGSLLFVLPIVTGIKIGSGTIKTNFYLLNISAIIILSDLYLMEELDKSGFLILKLIGPLLWGVANFFFILLVFDLIYKSSATPSLIALLIALLMFAFFQFDTFMKNIFPNWITQSHFHFMFIGTLLLTILAIGTQLIILQYDPSTGVSSEKFDRFKDEFSQSYNIRTVGIGITIVAVASILLGFTIQNYRLSGWSGVVLFIGLIIVEIVMIYQMRTLHLKKSS